MISYFRYATMLPDKFPNKNAKMFQDNNVKMFPNKYVTMSQNSNVNMFPNNNVNKFQNKVVDRFQNKFVTMSLNSNVNMFLAKYVTNNPDMGVEVTFYKMLQGTDAHYIYTYLYLLPMQIELCLLIYSCASYNDSYLTTVIYYYD